MTELLYEKPAALREIRTDNHAVIAASAGTGKTYTLQHLVVEILLEVEEARLDEILLVTFTVAATSDLKAKIRQTLEMLTTAWEKARSRDFEQAELVDGELREWTGDIPEESHWTIDFDGVDSLRHALRNFDRAAIYTIHGFCQRILIEHAFANRRLFEQEHVSEEDVIATGFAELMRQDIRPGTTAQQWLTAYLGAGNEIPGLRDDLADYTRSRGDYRPVESIDLNEFRDFGQRLVDHLESIDPDEWKQDRKPVAQDTEGTDAWASKGIGNRIEKLVEKFVPRWQPDNPVASLFAYNDALSGKFDYFRKDKSQALLAELGREGQLLGRIPEFQKNCELLVVTELGELLERRIQTVKSREGYFTFADMVTQVRDTLVEEGDGHLLDNIRSQFRYGLIDEFQDTDAEQWEIFEKVFVDSPADDRHFLYLIGDPKQAIYGFRGGDVYTYLDACQSLLDRGAVETSLTDNYRSTPAVLEGCNAIFDAGADDPVDLGEGIEYTERGVQPGLPWLQLREDGRPVEAGLTALELTTDREDPSTDDIRAGLVEQYAREIERIVDGSKTLEFRVEDGDGDDAYQQVGAEDIYVLCRRRADLHATAEALRNRGVPFAFLKMPGLFQTPEAVDVYDLLLALDSPWDRSRRARAWMTPFFDLSLTDIQGLTDIDEGHEIFEKLRRWSRLARSGDFAGLFNTILTESGLLRRRLLLERGERELTNYLHILEILAGEGARQIQTVQDLARRLKAFIDDRASPEGEDAEQQRLETEEAAVQLLTIHASKGLERGVVFVVPKFSSPTSSNPPYRYHEPDGDGRLTRVEWHGKLGRMPDDQRARWEAEAVAEELRLAYVAVTRAELMAYVPFARPGSAIRDHGYAGKDPFMQIVDRIDQLDTSGADTSFVDIRPASIDVRPPRPGDDEVRHRLEDLDWTTEDFTDDEIDEPTDEMRRQLLLRRWEVTSFSKLKQRGRTTHVEDEKSDEEEPTGVLPGGMTTGNFIHLVLEEIDYELVDEYSRDGWTDDPELREFFESCARRFGRFSDEAITEAMGLVYDTLRAPVQLADDTEIDGVRRLDDDRIRREIEFMFPVPENTDAGWRRRFRSGADIEGGFVTGIVDLFFEHGGRVYFADWKSDRAHPFDDDALGDIVEQRYDIQATLYSLAVCRMLGIDDETEYAEYFGGFFYFFVRGMTPDQPGRGIYSGKVDWQRLVEFERTLPETVREAKIEKLA